MHPDPPSTLRGSGYEITEGSDLVCVFLVYLLNVSVICGVENILQWTFAYPTTTRPDYGQISEITGYWNHHENRCIISTAIFSCHVIHHAIIVF